MTLEALGEGEGEEPCRPLLCGEIETMNVQTGHLSTHVSVRYCCLLTKGFGGVDLGWSGNDGLNTQLTAQAN